MNKLSKERILEVNGYESLPTYESCLLEKMIESSFSEKDEWPGDILSQVHTDALDP